MKRFLLTLCLLVLAGCSPSTPTDAPPLSTATPPPTLTWTPTFTPLPPTETPTPLPPTATLELPTETATPPPTAEAAEVMLNEIPYLSEIYGYQVAVPLGWQMVEMEDLLILTNDPQALANNTPTQAVIVSAGWLDTFLGGALVGVPIEGAPVVLQALIPQLLGPGFQPGEFETLPVGDLPAIGASLSGQDETGVSIEGYLTLILSDQRAAILLATAPADQWLDLAPLFTPILSSFTFTIP
ncbi:MAG: hypothetical protein JW726_19460 [Anaerolineales bacterium]|nr:hypothetical protein [Anaerolineales bacterium]